MPTTNIEISLENQIVKGLYEGIQRLQKEVEASGYLIQMGSEDEFYLYGANAADFEKKHGDALRTKFPLIHRIYKEENALLLQGTKIRLGCPGICKWEITTTYKYPDGRLVSAEAHAKLVTDIRRFIVEKQEEWDLQVDFGPWPIPDIQQAIKNGTLPVHITDAQALASIKAQVIAPEYEELYKERYLEADWPAIVQKLNKHKSAILSASTFDELCLAGIIVPKDAPTSGVDLNISLWKDGKNVFFDESVEHKTSPLFWSVAHAYIQLIGKETGSLLPSIQSYDAMTFTRLGNTRFGTSAMAAVTQDKTAGGCLKRSPPTRNENLVRARNQNHPDSLTEYSLRLERREGESGGGPGYSNDLAHPHYTFTAMLAIKNGLLASKDRPYSWEGLLAIHQEFNTSHRDALSSFKKSTLLKEGYGEKLHSLVSEHAALKTENH